MGLNQKQMVTIGTGLAVIGGLLYANHRIQKVISGAHQSNTAAAVAVASGATPAQASAATPTTDTSGSPTTPATGMAGVYGVSGLFGLGDAAPAAPAPVVPLATATVNLQAVSAIVTTAIGMLTGVATLYMAYLAIQEKHQALRGAKHE
jgi:hypothetical protein